jgi:hypothetical protein
MARRASSREASLGSRRPPSKRQALDQMQAALGGMPQDRRSGEGYRTLDRKVNEARQALQGDRVDAPRARSAIEEVLAALPAVRTVSAGGSATGGQVVVQQAAPTFQLTQPPPQLSVEQPQPEIIVRQPPPQVTVRMPKPQVTAHAGLALVAVRSLLAALLATLRRGLAILRLARCAAAAGLRQHGT